ncbi:hypothetical protein [Pseudonocardia sp. H11422]|uniref:hypothetical protein n=1 Tax=Pseudonocardia sp. H11422 TaxID=2835866 RepID=UPI001BDC10B9|nr:hypothetical protein [Pseudonocardia sp. H11422]
MESPPVSCALCGDVRDATDPAAPAWAGDHDERGRDRWLCPACARRHARDIEARLPMEWW